MVAAGAPSSSPMSRPSGSTKLKHEASTRPGFQPSAAAQSTAIEISSGRMARMRRSLIDNFRYRPTVAFFSASPLLAHSGHLALDLLWRKTLASTDCMLGYDVGLTVGGTSRGRTRRIDTI